jgi:glycosyltransferase involved in cell wall biosynthesis
MDISTDNKGNMNMRIHYLSDIYFGEKNAGTTHTLEIYERLAKNHEIHLICQKPINKIDLPHRLYIPTFGASHIPRMLILNLLFWTMYPVYFLSHKKPDVFYQRFDGSLFLSPALLFSKMFRIPLVMEVNGIMLDEISMRKVPSLYLTLVKFSERTYYKSASKLIVVTQGIKDETMRTYDIPEGKILVINNGVDVHKFRPLDDTGDLRKELGLEGKQIIAFIGIFVEWQGLDHLIEAAPLIIDKRPDTAFLLVGDGPLKGRLVNKAGETNVIKHFIFTGLIPYDQVPFFINLSDVCVVPKKPLKSGYSPLKLYEYMACGKPIVATRTGGFEILERSHAGILVDPSSSYEFSNSIVRLLQDSNLRKEMGENGRKYAVENCSWISIAGRVEQVLEQSRNTFRKSVS